MVTTSGQATSLINSHNTEIAAVLRPTLVAISPFRQAVEEQAFSRRGTDSLRDINTRLAALTAQLDSLTPNSVVLAKAAVTDTPPGRSPTVAANASWQSVAGDFQVWVDQLATSTRLASQKAVGQNVSTMAPLAQAGLQQTPTSGTFSVNGISFSYNAQVDSIDELIARINASDAGVVASYDPTNKKLNLLSRQSGEFALRLQDRLGNFLASTQLLDAPQSLGQNAVFRVSTVEGGRPLTSPSNSIANLLQGVTIDLLRVSKEPVSVRVNEDLDRPLALLRGFVDEFNQLLGTIRKYTSTGPAARRRTAPAVEGALRNIQSRLQAIMSTPAAPEEPTLADVGIALDGQGDGQALKLDQPRFRSALTDDPARLAGLFRRSAEEKPGVLQELGGYVHSLLSSDGPLATLQGSEGSGRTQRVEKQLGEREQEIVSRFQVLERTMQALQIQFHQLGQLAERK